jgi:TPR repeat protein
MVLRQRAVPWLRGFAEMTRLWRWNLIALSLILAPGAAIAGPFEDAVAAYKRKDYASALSLFRSLAEQGDTRAQGNVGVMYSHGEGEVTGSVLVALTKKLQQNQILPAARPQVVAALRKSACTMHAPHRCSARI